jgi:hypothetical protein
MRCSVRDAQVRVLVTDQKLTTIKQIIPLLEKVTQVRPTCLFPYSPVRALAAMRWRGQQGGSAV